jgi:hypothetical protein
MSDSHNDRKKTALSSVRDYIPAVIVTTWAVWLIIILIQGSGIKIIGSGLYNFEQAAKFGDAFGSLSGLMASLAAAGAWYAVHLQKVDSESREAGAAREIQLANKRNFEANFFQLLRHLSDIVNNTDIRPHNSLGEIERKAPDVGKDAFRKILQILRNKMDWKNLDDDDDEISLRYYSFYVRFQDDLGHYFRILYHLCNYVDSYEDVDREFYMKLTFAQLSNSELILLAYNCAYGRGKSKFRDLVIKYNGLTNIGFDFIDYAKEEVAIRSCYPEAVLPQ